MINVKTVSPAVVRHLQQLELISPPVLPHVRLKARITNCTSHGQSLNCDNEILSISDDFGEEGNGKNGTDIHHCLRPPQLSVRWPPGVPVNKYAYHGNLTKCMGLL